ncbi:oxidoreductase, aldo/keto reductase family [Syntrophotalea carbinolica DSM 2380]|uniref:Oxidoreductase, aldo/keto reductase family n=1 Tax=Syntrophotalea carbinolica (strain DSM 2380 / NBRC 103641 / GraBd1) TaxID=338963 RepID=Q3A7S5_SYNC1|nr:aldo/keto reductase [Syntrophotalea carbinolica]ABA87569.1 oxidoreductase, aldo/keto reductase family [Syntrophotalea carbinolica DSM 2380]
MIPKRVLGKTGQTVTCIGLGGEGVLRTFGREPEARNLIARALDLGITYMESARAYSGSESYYGRALGERRKEVFLASKAHERTAKGAWTQLQQTLENMRTEWLDLWQVHDVRTSRDLERIFGPGGAIEAFDRAKREGKVRFVGVTGHENPDILLQALDLYDFDTVLMPVNPAEPAWGSFPEKVLPEAESRGLGIVGMKVLCRGFGLQLPGLQNPVPWLRYALAQGVSTMVIGCDDPWQLEQNVAACSEKPMSVQECRQLEEAVAPWARKLMYYKP